MFISCPGYHKIITYFVCAVYILTVYGCQENAASKPLATVDGMKISYGEFKESFVKELNVFQDRSSLSPEDIDHLKEEILKNAAGSQVHLRLSIGQQPFPSNLSLDQKQVPESLQKNPVGS